MSHPEPTNHASVPAQLRPAELVVTKPVQVLPPAPSSIPDAMSLLKALQRRWMLAVSLGVLAAGAIGAAAWLLLPQAQYTVMATLQIDTNHRWIIFEPKEHGTDYKTYQKTQVNLIKDASILQDALSKPEIKRLSTVREQEDPLQWLGKELKAAFPDGSEILAVSLSGDRSQDAAAIVNAVVDSYMKLVVDEERKQRLARRDNLQTLWENYQKDVASQREQYKTMAQSAGANDQAAMAIVQQGIAEQIRLVRHSLVDAESNLRKAQANVAAREHSAARLEAAPVLSEAELRRLVEQDSEITALRQRLSELTKKMNEGERLARNAHSDPYTGKFRKEYDLTREKFSELYAQTREAILVQARQKRHNDLQKGLEEVRQEAGILKSLYEGTQAQLQTLQAAAKDTSGKSVDLVKYEQELKVADETGQKVRKELEAVKVELGAPERIRRRSEARPINTKDEEKRIKMSGIAAVGAFTFALLGISYWEFRARRIASPDDVVSALGLRLVGSLPALPTRTSALSRSQPGVPDRRWQSLLMESIDATRTMLLHASRQESIRVVMVTSAIKGEGKTSLACHLATSLARAGRNTLLVYCDLRSPACHRLFDLPPSPGLCELLRGEAELADVIEPTPADHLCVLPAGQVDAVAIQALAREDLRALFDTLKGQFDFIIVDSVPVLPLADALLISQHVDAVLFSILREVSRLPMVHAAYERLATLGVKVLGAVVAGVRSDEYGYGYEYGTPVQAAV